MKKEENKTIEVLNAEMEFANELKIRLIESISGIESLNPSQFSKLKATFENCEVDVIKILNEWKEKACEVLALKDGTYDSKEKNNQPYPGEIYPTFVLKFSEDYELYVLYLKEPASTKAKEPLIEALDLKEKTCTTIHSTSFLLDEKDSFKLEKVIWDFLKTDDARNYCVQAISEIQKNN